MSDERDPRTLDELVACIANDPDRARAEAAGYVAKERVGFHERWPYSEDRARLDELDADQRRVAEAIARRTDIAVGGGGPPTTPRALRRWLGLEAPSIMERPIPWQHDGAAVTWSLGYAWRRVDDEELESGLGVPARIAAMLTPAELIEATGEAALEGYGIEFPLAARAAEALRTDAAGAMAWARDFAARAAVIRSPDGPRARDDVPGYNMLGIYDWDAIGVLALLPFAAAGEPIDPSLDVVVPFAAAAEFTRPILEALPMERREAVVYRRLMTDWGPSGVRALNGFESGLAVLDLVPSLRVAKIVIGKLRNNRGHFRRAMDRIMARLEAIAATEPAVEKVLHRGTIQSTRVESATKKPAAKKPAAKKPAAKKPAAKKP